MTCRSGKDREHGISLIEDSFSETRISESDEFLSSEFVPTTRFLPRGLKPLCNSMNIVARTLFINNRIARSVLSIIRTTLAYLLIIYRISTKIIPPHMAIHIFAAILVTVGTLTLFISPMFRSKLSEMRERPISMQNGIIDAMAWSSDQYAVIQDTPPPINCLESYFRCEYYWASDTTDATDKYNTAYCSAYVCKGMTVTVNVLPQSCSTTNRVAIGVLLKEIYAKPVFSCGNSGCGVCSTLRYHSSEDGEVSFLQGCDDEESCYGQIEVSLTWDRPVTAAAAPSVKIKSRAPWQGFRGGQLSQGVSRIRSKIGNEVSLKWEIMGGAFISSPAISTAGVAYVGSDDNNLYALKSNGKSVTTGAILWKFLTLGKVQSSPLLSFNENSVYIGSLDHYLYSLNSQNGVLLWKFLTGGEILSSPSMGIDPLTSNSGANIDSPGVLYVGSNDGFLYAISTSGILRWKFSTAVSAVNGLSSGCGMAVLGPIKSSPSISPDDSVIYFGSDNGHLYAVSNLGLLKWNFKIDGVIISSPAISSDGLSIYFGSDDDHFYALSSTGILKWRYNIESPISSSPALFEGVLYFGSMSKIHSDKDKNKNKINIVKEMKNKKTRKSTIIGRRMLFDKNENENEQDHENENERILSIDNVSNNNNNSNDINKNIKNNINNNDIKNKNNNNDLDNRYIVAKNNPKNIPIINPANVPIVNPKNIPISLDKSMIINSNKQAAIDDNGSLFALTTKGELLWRLRIPKGTVSSPLIGADGSIYIGTEDSTLLSVSEDGVVQWAYRAHGPITSSPGIDTEGSIYIGTSNHSEVDSSSSSGRGSLTVVSVGTRVATPAVADADASFPSGINIQNKVQVSQNISIPTLVQVPVDKSWYCSPESLDFENTKRGILIDKFCKSEKVSHSENRRFLKNNHNDNNEDDVTLDNNKVKRIKKEITPLHSCLPGLSDYIGKGVDITLQRDDPNFITTRLFEFSSMKQITFLHGVEYFAPPLDRLFVAELDDLEITNPVYSDVFTGVRVYTMKQSQSYNVTSNIITGKIPLDAVSSILANSTGSWTSTPVLSIANKIAKNIEKNKITLMNVASYSHAKYDLLPQPQIGHMCSLPFVEDTEDLSDEFDELTYLSYVKRFGTHVIVGATYGGTVSAESTYDPCNAIKNNRYATPREVFDNFKKDIGDFIVYSKQTEISFLGQLVRRNGLTVCGGDQSVFMADNKDAFSDWSKSTITRKNKPCVVTFQLVPLYAAIPPDNPRRKQIESAVLDYMNKAKNFASHNITEISTCKNKNKKLKV